MSIELLIILQILFAHWVSDFVLQSSWMATNKSKYWSALGAHVAVYTLSFAIVLLFLSATFIGYGVDTRHTIFSVLDFNLFVIWIAVNGLLHFVTDNVTSKITSRLWSKGDMHNFFVVVGFDQMIHYFCLFGTLVLLF